MNQFDIQTTLRNALTTNAPLASWLSTHYAQGLTVLIGNRPLKKIRPEEYPLVVIVFEPESVAEKVVNTPHWLIENYHFEIGIYNTDVEQSLQHLAELEQMIIDAALPALRGMLTGSDEHAGIVDRIADQDVNHPYHFIGIKAQVRRHATY